MFTRREMMGSAGILVAAAGVAGAQGTGKGAAAPAPAPAAKGAPPAGAHEPKPLPFDPKKLVGISEKMIVSHHDNNYTAAVKNLGKVQAELAQTTKDTPGFVISGLREKELTFTNSMILHELYFGNLGGDGKASGAIEKRLAEAAGSFAAWEEAFRAVGASLGGGSGWAIVDLVPHTGELRTYWAGNHTQTVAGGIPLLIMDMYEHAYAMDYGAAAAKYIDAFFQNIHWDEINRRLARADKAVAALKG